MPELNLEVFNKRKSEIQTIVESSKGLSIKGVDDKIGYDLVKASEKKLQRARLDLKEDARKIRAEALDFQKKIIGLEKDLLEIIEPAEKEMKDKRTVIDDIKKLELRKKSLNGRMEKLKELELEVEPVFLLSLDDKQFNEYFYDEKAKYLEAKQEKDRLEKEEADQKLQEAQDKIDEQNRKIEADKLAIENDKKVAEAKENTKKDEKRNYRIQRLNTLGFKIAGDVYILGELQISADCLSSDDGEFEKVMFDTENKVKELNKIESDRIAKENLDKETAEKLRIKKEEELQLMSKKKLIDFLKSHGYSNANKDDYVTKKDGDKIVLFKKVGEIIV